MKNTLPVNSVAVSVVTYTYNDNALVAGLLDSIESWNVCPSEVIVVDDGSSEPFTHARTIHGTAPRVIRNASNRGVTEAKQLGMASATGRFILSVDADTRPSPDWLQKCLPLAAQPNVGMVSTSMHYRAGDSTTAQYLRLTCSYTPRPGEVPMIPGPIFLMRKAVFDEVGGFSGYGEPIGEDAYLNQVVSDAGYGLVIAEGAHAVQVRRLSRVTAAKRMFVWQKNFFLRELDKGTPLAEAVNVYVYSISKRPSFRHENTSLVYIDLLQCVYGLLHFFERQNELFDEACAFFRHCLGRFESLFALLLGDLGELGYDLRGYPAVLKMRISSFEQVFTEDICTTLDQDCPVYRLEDESLEDYSMYRDMRV